MTAPPTGTAPRPGRPPGTSAATALHGVPAHTHPGRHRRRPFAQAQPPQRMQPRAHFGHLFRPVLRMQRVRRVLGSPVDAHLAGHDTPSLRNRQHAK